ncbi:MAG: FAD-binding protein [Rickettsiales bacterium]
MERYAPKYKALASRDVVTRSIMKEIAEGRGAGAKKDHVLLDIRHLAEEIIDKQLPGTRSIAAQFAGVEVLKEPIPVVPTAHYCMGGIPATRECEVLGKDERIVNGLYAVGEAACNSVHGANRLGCNSLLDLVVFGKHSGEVAASRADAKKLSESDIPKASLDKALAHFNVLSSAKGKEAPTDLRRVIRNIVQETAGIIREEESMRQGLQKLEQIAGNFSKAFHIGEAGLAWNNMLVAAIETENLLLQGIATLASAQFRTESRGAHYRSDCPHRDDDHWLAHTIVEVNDSGKPKCYTRPVRFNTGVAEAGTVQPETRVY